LVVTRRGQFASILSRPLLRTTGPLLRSRWSLPVYAFIVAFAIVMVMVTDPYSGAFADVNTAPSHWGETFTWQTLATGSTSSTTISRDAVSSHAAPKVGPPAAGIPDAGSAQAIALAILTAAGMGNDQYSCLVSLWNRESHWRVDAANPNGAYGIPQALPGSKMASAGPDWQTNATTQIKWGLGYIKARYGTPCGAWAHSQASGWY
jgi:hypothetical protein